MEVVFKYTYDGHDMGHAHVNFDEKGELREIYTFSGDIVYFPRELSAWRLTKSGHLIEAEEPHAVWAYIKANPEKWKTTDPLPEGA